MALLTHVLLKDILRGQLRKLNCYEYAGAENEFSATNIEKAIHDLDVPLAEGLLGSSEKICHLLMWGTSYGETVGAGKQLSFNLKYIDWEHPEKQQLSCNLGIYGRKRGQKTMPAQTLCCLSMAFLLLLLNANRRLSVTSRPLSTVNLPF